MLMYNDRCWSLLGLLDPGRWKALQSLDPSEIAHPITQLLMSEDTRLILSTLLSHTFNLFTQNISPIIIIIIIIIINMIIYITIIKKCSSKNTTKHLQNPRNS